MTRIDSFGSLMVIAHMDLRTAPVTKDQQALL